METLDVACRFAAMVLMVAAVFYAVPADHADRQNTVAAYGALAVILLYFTGGILGNGLYGGITGATYATVAWLKE